MSSWDEYKEYTARHAGSLDTLRKTVLAIVTRKQLASCMNDAKWLELQDAVRTLPFPPAFTLRRVTDPDGVPGDVFGGKAPWWEGNWSNYYAEGMPPLFDIEWIAVWPQKSVHRGRLVPDAIVDAAGPFRDILERLNIPYEEERGIFTIYGYRAG